MGYKGPDASADPSHLNPSDTLIRPEARLEGRTQGVPWLTDWRSPFH